MLITENMLDEWVRGNAQQAQGVIVELIQRLIGTTSPRQKGFRFPQGDSIGQHGPDVVLDVELPFDPFIPGGYSVWEIGTNLKANDKATSDYRYATKEIPESTRHDSTFVFVTPLSARRGWEFSWKEDAQATWLEARRSSGDWKDIRIIDGTQLIHWLQQFPAIELWLARACPQL